MQFLSACQGRVSTFKLLLFWFSLSCNPAPRLLAASTYLGHCENTVYRLVLRIHALQLHPYFESIFVVWERLILQRRRTVSILLKAYQRKTEYLHTEKNNDYLLFMFLKELINHFKISSAFLKTYSGKEKLMIVRKTR